MTLKEQRLALNLTKKAVAHKMGWGVKKLTRVEEGTGSLKDQQLLVIFLNNLSGKSTPIINSDSLQGLQKKRVGGIMAKVFATLPSGQLAMIKRVDSKEGLHEYIAHRLGELLGLKVNTVNLTTAHRDLTHPDSTDDPHTTFFYSVHHWIDTFTPAVDSHYTCSPQSQHLMTFFDCIIGNTDRHKGNYGFDSQGNLWLIDHAYSEITQETDFEHRFRNRNILEHLQRDPDLHSYLDKFLSLSAADFLSLFDGIPAEWTTPHPAQNYKTRTINRLLNIQKYLIKEVAA